MTPGEIRRLYFIIRTFLSYGLDYLIPKMRITLPLRIWRRMLFWMPNRHKGQPLGERLRLALQELGPVWIKFGQMLSTRRDLFPPHIADELAMLQDRVAPFDGVMKRYAPPFTAERHEALGERDLYFARFREDGALVRVGR